MSRTGNGSVDVIRCREQFPALRRRVAGRPAIYFDGPAGSQVPERVIRAVADCLAHTNANHGGEFATSRESDAMLAAAHRAFADFVGTADPEEIVFGANMTTLTLAVSRALARTWTPGDEVLISRLDHDANFTPWVRAAADAGATVRAIDIRPDGSALDMDDFAAKLSERTRLVAVTCASNAVGTVPPIVEITSRAHDVGALVFLDAVHYAPHRAMDVRAWDCDFLVCSTYKFFGPHVGVLWGKRQVLSELPAYKVRPADDAIPARWMTGTQNHEGIAGAAAAVEYIADLGGDDAGDGGGRRARLLRAYERIGRHEATLASHLLGGLSELPRVRVWGNPSPVDLTARVPTVSLTHESVRPAALAGRLAEHGIFVWHGNFYALPLTEALGLEPEGMVRIGILHYNTPREVDRLLEALEELEG